MHLNVNFSGAISCLISVALTDLNGVINKMFLGHFGDCVRFFYSCVFHSEVESMEAKVSQV